MPKDTQSHATESESPIEPESSANAVEEPKSPDSSQIWQRVSASFRTWAPITIAVISFTISLYTFFTTQSKPDVVAVLQRQVRIAQGGPAGTLLYLEPAFLHTGPSQRVEVIVDLEATVTPIALPQSDVAFVWREKGTWSFVHERRELNYHYIGDPSPFLIGPANAAQFTALFYAADDWRFAPGVYRITLEATRLVRDQPILIEAEIHILDEDVEYLNASQGARFLTFPLQSLTTSTH